MQTSRISAPSGVELLRTLDGHTDRISRIAWSPDGAMLASPSEDGTIQLWDAQTGTCIRTLERHDVARGFYCCATFSRTIPVLAAASALFRVELWNPTNGDFLRDLEGHLSWVMSVSFSPNADLLASGGADWTVKLWDVQTGWLIRSLEGHREIVNAVAIDASGTLLASGSDDSTVRLWDVATGRLLRTLEGHPGEIYSICFDAAGMVLATAGQGGIINVWDTRSGLLVRALEGHTGSVHSIGLAADGRLLASKGADSTLRLWRSDTGACVLTIPNPASSYSWLPGLAFHPRLSFLSSVGSASNKSISGPDTVVHIWKLNFDYLLAQTGDPMVTNTSVKIVLVGESNVGKSYLLHRIVTDECPLDGTIPSTHGMNLVSVSPERLSSAATPPQGQRREVMLWDMGGQDEYRLVHQLFLHDTTVALVLLDPARGQTAFEEVEAWCKRLDKQLRGRRAVRLLVGAKQDKFSDTVDRKGLERLQKQCNFAGYFETSALNGRGVAELLHAISASIDWDTLARTTRPELFQQIRDEIEVRRKRGDILLHLNDLHRSLSLHRAAANDRAEEETKVVDTVAEQLASQGIIARARVSSGESVLVLQVYQIERYAGSLILAARNNPRGVPALELRAIARLDFELPGIKTDGRLPPEQERPILECTVQLLLEHGICFQHEGLLIFPTLFSSNASERDPELLHAVSLYYDFAGAIDNIYASLIAWLVLARDFGQVRLWPDRAEFELGNEGLCGLRKVGRPGGFAHVDVYFGNDTPLGRRDSFIAFVEDHLRLNGVDIREHLVIACPCGHKLDEETLRRRLALGHHDVPCPVCETRHNLLGGVAESRERPANVGRSPWALKTEIGRLRQKISAQAVEVIKGASAKSALRPIRLLHLSDLHFNSSTLVPTRLQWLLDDIKRDSGLGFKELDYLVISGDFADRGCVEGFQKAYEFLSGLMQEFGLSAERVVLVPGNHDVSDMRECYEWRDTAAGLSPDDWVQQGEVILARTDKYSLRFKPFSDGFFHKLIQKPYPADYAAQGMAVPFWDTGIQFLALNSCWQIDKFHRRRSGIHPEALAHVLSEARKQETERYKTSAGGPLLRIAVWHHAATGPEGMKNIEFLGHLQNDGVRLALHGDVHEMRRDLIGYWHAAQKLYVVGSGSFGAKAGDRPESTPRLYNLLEINRTLRSVRVHTRCQPQAEGSWRGWNEWPKRSGEGFVPYYEIKF